MDIIGETVYLRFFVLLRLTATYIEQKIGPQTQKPFYTARIDHSPFFGIMLVKYRQSTVFRLRYPSFLATELCVGIPHLFVHHQSNLSLYTAPFSTKKTDESDPIVLLPTSTTYAGLHSLPIIVYRGNNAKRYLCLDYIIGD